MDIENSQRQYVKGVGFYGMAKCIILAYLIVGENYDFGFLLPRRRLLLDDSRGVDEALNETVCVLDDCRGLAVSKNYPDPVCGN